MGRNISIVATALLLLFLSGCSSINRSITEYSKVQSDEARVDFYAQRVFPEREFIGLMCRNQQVTDVAQIRDLPAGDHVLWVKAVLYHAHHNNRVFKEATAKFNVSLDGGTRYTVARQRDGDELKLWIAESESGVIVSDVITTQATTGAAITALNYNDRFNQCREGTA